MSAIELNEENFTKEVLEASVPVLVDFWAAWCGPCKMLSPIIDELAGEIGETAKVAKLDIDKSNNLAQKYGVRSIPTLLFFVNGEVKEQVVGAAHTKENLKEKLNNLSA